MEERITVKEFVNKYLSLEKDIEKQKYIESIVTRTYVPVLEKQVVLQAMLNQAIVTKGNTKYINMFLSKINMSMAIIVMYTNLKSKHEKEDNETSFDDYDLLRQHDLFNRICGFIGDSELRELAMIQDTLMQTFHNEYSSTEAYVSRLVENIGIIMKGFEDTGLKQIMEILEHYEGKEK